MATLPANYDSLERQRRAEATKPLRKEFSSSGDMYMQTPSQSVLLPKESTWQQRRPNLTLTKSPLWSYSAGRGAHSYPSPPMSDSPRSPRRISQHPSANSYGGSGTSAPAPTEAPTQDSRFRDQAVQPPAAQSTTQSGGSVSTLPGPQRQELQPRPPTASLPTTAPYHELYAASPSFSMAPMLGEQYRTQLPPVTFAGPVSAPTPSVPRIPRTSRRAKAHVAKACQNCKKAHLSCDEARPCARCVASGKQSTCIDVEHKKRGRPRLRDEGAGRAEQSSMQMATEVGPVGGTAGRGHRRTDSYQRQLRSRARPESQGTVQLPHPLTGPVGIGTPFQKSGDSAESFYAAKPEPELGLPELVAFVNLDLQILKCNEAFSEMFGVARDARGRLLSDFIDRRHESQVHRLQNELREERSRREPTFLPSIFPDQQEQQAVQDIDDKDVERITQGYEVRQQSWTYVLPDGKRDQLLSRVSLARTSIYFAVVVLRRVAQTPPTQKSISGRPTSIELPAPIPTALPAASPRLFQFLPPGPPSPFHPPSAPGSPFSSLQNLGTTLPPTSSSVPAPYLGPSRSDPSAYLHRFTPYPPSSDIRPTSIPSVRPRSTTIEGMTSFGAGRKRPQDIQVYPRAPIGSAPATPLGSGFLPQPSTVRSEPSYGRTPERREREDDDTLEESARKRRRTGMDIKDVLGK